MPTMRVFKNKPTHVILSLKTVEDYGWEMAIIMAVIEHYGNCEQVKINEALPFIDPKIISFLIDKMKKEELVGE